VKSTPYIIGDASYLIQPYLQKKWKTHNVVDVDKHIYYDSNMNIGRMFIENAFGSLKNKWHILRHYNLKVDRVIIVVVACYVLHNYCLKWGAPEPRPPNIVVFQDNLQGFGDI
jgi:hypothetical protein